VDDIDYISSLCNRTFEKRGSLVSLWQELADQFYPERADFTRERTLGTDFAGQLTSSWPLLARRDMGDMFAAMLRPTDIYWFKITTNNYDYLDYESKLWLERSSKTQWNAMHDRKTMFHRATKEGDHDYATFGQCVISNELQFERDTMLYRCWHLRDMAWLENEKGETIPIFRKWKPSLDHLVRSFGLENLSKEMQIKYKDKNHRYMDVDVIHAIVPADFCEGEYRTPYVSLFYEAGSKHVIKKSPSWTKVYSVPRWQTVSGSQYSFSPATVAALPDARLFQQMTLVILEAGEKAANPPLVATQDVVRSDVHQYAGGVTWVDSEYDERLGEALRPMTLNSNGIALAMQLRDDIKRAIESSFYIDKIGLPQMGTEMTAFETAQRVKEYMRKIVPLFSPVEQEYNGSLCEDTFEIMLRAGAFGRMDDLPDMLRGEEIKFQFRSPLSETLDRQKAQSYQEAKAMLAESMALDPSSGRMIDLRKALRDTLESVGVPQEWIRPEEELQAMEEADKQQQQMQEAAQSLQLMQQGSEAALTMGKAAGAFQEAGIA